MRLLELLGITSNIDAMDPFGDIATTAGIPSPRTHNTAT
jgi:hypothetical protein